MRIERLFMSNSACAWNDRSKADDRGKRRRMRAFAYSLKQADRKRLSDEECSRGKMRIERVFMSI